jgi:hypothetical protein
MSNLVEYAKSELARIPINDHIEDEMEIHMQSHILKMVEEFSKEGHSGFSANMAIAMLTRLLSYKPLSPLTGEDDEWMEVSEDHFQNKRYSSVFKDKNTGKAYDIDGKVFWEWYVNDETGEKFKSYFTCYESRTDVEFPYHVPDKPIYEERITDEN